MKRLKASFKYIFLTLISILSIFPLYWMAVSSTNTSTDVISGKLLPGVNFINNWRNLIISQDVFQAFTNSAKNAICLTFISLLVCSLAGYGFEVYHDKKKDIVMFFLLLSMMVPFVAILIPLFQMFAKAGFLNSTIGFILPTISTPFLIMMFRQSTRSFPHDIIEAARIDGFSEMRIFTRVYIPTMKSTYLAAMTITFMNAWNSYLWPKVIMMTNKSVTIPMLVANLLSGYVIDYGLLNVAILICTLPTVIIFFFLQKSFTEGVAGSVK